MAARQQFLRPVLLLSTLILSVVSTFPISTRAASATSTVWVMDDITPQTNCTVVRTYPTRTDQPCPAGTIHHVYQVPLAQAQAEQRPYLPTDASPIQEAQWQANVYAQTLTHSRTTSSVTPNYVGCSPTNGATTTLFWTTNYGSNVSTGVHYTVDNSCIFRAQYDLTQYNGGAEAHKYNVVCINDATTGRTCGDVDSDANGGVVQCSDLPHQTFFAHNGFNAADTLTASNFQIYDHNVNGACIDAHDVANFTL